MRYTPDHPYIQSIIQKAALCDNIVIDGFAGMGGVTEGFEKAGNFYVIAAVNHWKEALQSHALNHPHCLHLEEDFRTADLGIVAYMVERIRELNPNVCVHIWLSLECFTAGTMILSNRGFIDIKDIAVGDFVLTHMGRYRKVTSIMNGKSKTHIIRGQGVAYLETTANHPFYSIEKGKKWDNPNRRWQITYGMPSWTTTAKLIEKKSMLASPVEFPSLPIPKVKGRGFDFSDKFWWMIGYWLGNGSISNRGINKQITISCGKHDKEFINSKLKEFFPKNSRSKSSEFRAYAREVRTAINFDFFHDGLATWILENFNKLAYAKTIPSWVYSMDESWRRYLLAGYLRADGSFNGQTQTASTVSKKLALGIKLLAQTLGHSVSIYKYESRNNPIEGRLVNCRPFYMLQWKPVPDILHTTRDQRHIWGTVKKITATDELKTVYNISVEEDESYVADGIVVHNCTNFSNAKGGMPRNADSRTLADSADRYVEQINPDVLWIENVREFMVWGPMIPKIQAVVGSKKQTIHLDCLTNDPVPYFSSLADRGIYAYCPLVIDKFKDKDKPMDDRVYAKVKKKWATIGPWMIPDPEFKGRDFKRWCRYIKTFGYDCYFRLFNMADYGVPQHRVRLIMQFTRNGVSPIYPNPTHSKNSATGLVSWLPVKNCLDLEDEGDSILSFLYNKKGERRPRIKSKKTIDRVINGVIKHVLNGKRDDSFIVNYNHSTDSSSIHQSSNAIMATERYGIGKAKFLSLYYSQGQRSSPLVNPSPALSTKDRAVLNTAYFIDKQFGGNKYNHQNVMVPAGSLTGNPKFNLETIRFIDFYYSDGQQNKSINEPSGGLMGNPKQRLINVEKFIMSHNYDNKCKSVNDPSRPILASRKHYYVVSASFNNQGHGIDRVSATIIARMDKKPPYLIETELGEAAIEVYDYDPPHYVKLKKFMAENGIVEIRMRMFKKVELKRIMTIPENYVQKGTEADQKKMIGNAVPPLFVTALAQAYDQNRPRPDSMKVA